ncbi:MAG: Fe-Mn family superoxide dismutase, partial [Candidatus Methylomirabilis sp.]|nr:Fe-Mn family superoxide dismutase [Deltaproteobacteria bacterium]
WNEIQEKLAKADRSAANYSFGEFSELKRREAVAFNGTYLHELYFESLARDGGKPSAALESALAASFGSLDGFYDDLKGSGASTPGWVLLTKSKTDGRLHTFVLYEHHVGLPVHQTVLLAMDCWEHAFMVDYGTKKAAYLDAFIANIDWTVSDKRFAAAR